MTETTARPGSAEAQSYLDEIGQKLDAGEKLNWADETRVSICKLVINGVCDDFPDSPPLTLADALAQIFIETGGGRCEFRGDMGLWFYAPMGSADHREKIEIVGPAAIEGQILSILYLGQSLGLMGRFRVGRRIDKLLLAARRIAESMEADDALESPFASTYRSLARDHFALLRGRLRNDR